MAKPRTYDYVYDADNPYVYTGTKVLANKFGLRDLDELWNIERAITGVTAAELEAKAPGLFIF